MVAIIEKDNLNSLQSILNKIVDGGVWKKKKKKTQNTNFSDNRKNDIEL